MNTITLFNGTKSQTTFNLLTDLVLVDIDEQDNDLLAVLDLRGITLEYISTNKGLDLDDTYIAKSKFEAVKAFLVKYKGKYLIHSVFEV